MFMRQVCLLSGLLLTASVAYAAQEEANPIANPDKIICKNAREHRTGSNMRTGRGECKTAAEWEDRRRAAQRELTRLRDKAQTPGLAIGR
jgi:hypothetical protein